MISPTHETLELQAFDLVKADGMCSTSYIQRKLGIGYNTAARLVEALETGGVVSASDNVGKRDILIGPEDTWADFRDRVLPDGATGTMKVPPASAPAGPGHNSGDASDGPADTYRVTADELRSFIERTERLEQEKKDIAEQVKEVMAEAKGRGYDTKVMRKVIALRKRGADDIAEEEAVTDLYCEALGIVR